MGGYGCVCGFRIQNEVLISEFCFCIFRGWNPVWGFLLLHWNESRGLVSLTQHHLTLRVLRLRCWKVIFLRNRNTGFYGIFSQIRAAYRVLFPLLEAQSAPYCVVSLVVWCGNGTKLSPEKHECEGYLPIPDVVQEKPFRGTPWLCFLLRVGCQHQDIWGEGRVIHWRDPDSPSYAQAPAKQEAHSGLLCGGKTDCCCIRARTH